MLLERRQRGGAPSFLTPKPDTPITQKDGLHLNGQLSLHQPLNHAEPGHTEIRMHTCRFEVS